MATQQAAMLGGGGQTTNDPRTQISMQQSSWNGQPMMNSAEMGATSGNSGPHLGPGINATYGNTGMIPGSHAQAMGGGMMMSGGVTYQAGDFGSCLLYTSPSPRDS